MLKIRVKEMAEVALKSASELTLSRLPFLLVLIFSRWKPLVFSFFKNQL